jgi:hypothetical protein
LGAGGAGGYKQKLPRWVAEEKKKPIFEAKKNEVIY